MTTWSVNMGAGAMDFGELLDGDFPLGGGSFYSINATYLARADATQDTRIKYTSPTFGGFSFAVDFTPVVGGVGPCRQRWPQRPVQRRRARYYENVVTGGVQ